ncbi:AAA family ATPase [[Mycoplasma] testudinis]|uniref:AAA family ATPase n=1 Tax=[Mycoplasma] testudinis TaxID=33924 RepID=UPI000B266353|nr:AAA family ATPase [[Mycoplasma] testudinis]
MNQNLRLADTNIKILLEGKTPRLIDQWQLAPKLWDAIRFEVDHRHSFNQFILTGSSSIIDKTQIIHSGTGRFTRILMRPLSLYESENSSGAVSLKKLFNNRQKDIKSDDYTIHDIAFFYMPWWMAFISK